MRFVFSLLLGALILSGCGSSTPPASQIAEEVKQEINAAQNRGGLPTFPTVYLVESSPNHYDGYVQDAQGKQIMLKVTRQDDGQALWQLSP